MANKEKDRIEYVIAAIIALAIVVLIVWGMAAALAWCWNTIVVKEFSNVPMVETSQMLVIVIGAYVITKIIKWW